jgi:hypothetical protein
LYCNYFKELVASDFSNACVKIVATKITYALEKSGKLMIANRNTTHLHSPRCFVVLEISDSSRMVFDIGMPFVEFFPDLNDFISSKKVMVRRYPVLIHGPF